MAGKTLAGGDVADLSGRRFYLNPVELDDKSGVKPVAGKPDHWGYHLIIDMSNCNRDIDDEKAVKAFFRQLVADLKMKTLTDVEIVRPKKEEGRGLTAVQVITTSSITFHGDDDKWSVYLDIFSCKPFDPKVAISLIKKCFAPKHIGGLWLHRDAGRWPEK